MYVIMYSVYGTVKLAVKVNVKNLHASYIVVSNPRGNRPMFYT